MSDLSEKVAVVTGAATGIGESIARRLFAGGARLVVVGHDKSGLDSLLKDIDRGGARSRAVEGDVRDAESLAEAISLAEEAFGGLHIAVNNAGVTGPGETLIEDLSLDDWDAVIGTNLTGMFLSLKSELPLIVESGGGAVLNLSSANGIVGLGAIRFN